MTKTQQNEIAETIIRQLGGRKFALMTGAKDFIALPEGACRFKIGRNATSTNTVTVTYDLRDDLYSMFFERVSLSRKTWAVTRKEIKSFDGVFADQLQELFTSVTGLYTRL